MKFDRNLLTTAQLHLWKGQRCVEVVATVLVMVKQREKWVCPHLRGGTVIKLKIGGGAPIFPLYTYGKTNSSV